MTPASPLPHSPNGAFPAVAAAALLALAAAVMWPALGAGFLQDDWDFLASSAHLPTPWPYYFENYSRGYFYRPNGMLAWWLLNRTAGLAPAWHYGVQIAVHAGCAMAVLGLARKLGASRPAAMAAAAVFVVHPGSVASSLWLSARFDLLAALGILLCLRLLFSQRLGRPMALLGLAGCAWLAVGAKEIGVLVLPLAAVALWLRPGTASRLPALIAVMLPVLVWFVLRLMVLGSDDVTTQLDPAVLAGHFTAGVGLWFRYLPQAMSLYAPAWLGGVALAVLMMATLAALPRGRTDPMARRAWLGLALLLLPPFLQWPITHFTLAMPDPLGISVSLRFYFLSLCGAAVLLTVAIDAVGLKAGRPDAAPGRRTLAAGLAALLLLPLGLKAHLRASQWTAETAPPDALRMQASLADRFRALAGGAGCKLVFEGASSANLPGFADHIAKAHLPRGHRALDSLVVTDPMPWSAIVGPAGARPAALAPLPNRMTGPVELLPAPVGPLFYVSLDYSPDVLADGTGCSPLSLRWNGTAFVPVVPSTLPQP